MILFLYNIGLVLALLVSAPWWLWQMAATSKYREGLSERLGRVPKRLSERLLDAPGTRPVIWIHAVSVGEVLAISRLIAELDAALPTHRLLISTTTRTGQTLARERFGADRVFYCPLDLPWAVSAYLNALGPQMLILAETEFWPNLLSACFRRQIPVVVVNARISDRSWPRYQLLRRLWMPFLSKLTAVLAQTGIDADRLHTLGCSPGRISVSGNLKFDVRATQEASATAILRSLGNRHRFVVAGSTLDGEEEMLLAAWKALAAESVEDAPGSGRILVIAPRHPERFVHVASLIQRSGLNWRRRTELGDTPLVPGEVVLLDSIGELASVYSLASAAFVGGSLIEAGGHNPLEPAQFAIPILMGPHYANFREIVDLLRNQNAITILSKSGLANTLASLLGNREDSQAMGQRAHHVFESQSGATSRTVAAIVQIAAPQQSNHRRPA